MSLAANLLCESTNLQCTRWTKRAGLSSWQILPKPRESDLLWKKKIPTQYFLWKARTLHMTWQEQALRSVFLRWEKSIFFLCGSDHGVEPINSHQIKTVQVCVCVCQQSEKRLTIAGTEQRQGQAKYKKMHSAAKKRSIISLITVILVDRKVRSTHAAQSKCPPVLGLAWWQERALKDDSGYQGQKKKVQKIERRQTLNYHKHSLATTENNLEPGCYISNSNCIYK